MILVSCPVYTQIPNILGIWGLGNIKDKYYQSVFLITEPRRTRFSMDKCSGRGSFFSLTYPENLVSSVDGASYSSFPERIFLYSLKLSFLTDPFSTVWGLDANFHKSQYTSGCIDSFLECKTCKSINFLSIDPTNHVFILWNVGVQNYNIGRTNLIFPQIDNIPWLQEKFRISFKFYNYL